MLLVNTTAQGCCLLGTQWRPRSLVFRLFSFQLLLIIFDNPWAVGEASLAADLNTAWNPAEEAVLAADREHSIVPNLAFGVGATQMRLPRLRSGKFITHVSKDRDTSEASLSVRTYFAGVTCYLEL